MSTNGLEQPEGAPVENFKTLFGLHSIADKHNYHRGYTNHYQHLSRFEIALRDPNS